VCGEAPVPELRACPGCGRADRTESGALDYLYGDSAERARRFAEPYTALRRREGWRDRHGREDPGQRLPSRLWRSRKRAAEAAVKLVHHHLLELEPPLVADVGAGGGWLGRMLRPALTAAVDVIEPPAGAGAHLRVVADMRQLPFRDHSLNAAVYCSSLQYAPLAEAVGEAARVLRPGGVLVAVESAIFTDAAAAEGGHRRAVNYFERAGVPELAEYHFPIAAEELRDALGAARFVIERLDEPQPAYGPGQMIRGPKAFPMLVARRS
jgi:SAM-dependent methyltransferase